MRASIVIAAHNEGQSLWKTVASIIESSVGLDYEIVVADDASDDGSMEEMLRRFPRVRVVRHQQRRGASPTKDLGARDARGEVLVFLDGHTNPQPGAILQLVEDVERVEGRAIITPTVEALDVERWRNSRSQVGHGYRLELERFECGWLPLGELRQVRQQGRTFYESPALIGCALAVGRKLYEDLRGFDPHMRFWGVEDLDFGLKCWLMGYSILHDPEAVVGHRFRRSFDNYDVPIEQLVANQLRMARKSFTHSVWSNWLDSCRRRHSGRLAEHPEGLWVHIWNQFEADRASVEEERAYLQARRVRDEFSYAEHFGLTWPRLATAPLAPLDTALEAMAAEPSPSPSPCPESDKGNWYNGFWKKGMTDLVGADAKIETHSPKLDCEPNATFWDASSAWVGVTLQNGAVDTWAQVGYRRWRVTGSTKIWRRIYAECQIGSVFHRKHGKVPGAGMHRYLCNMIDPAEGRWDFYYDGVGFSTFQHNDWKDKKLNTFEMCAETHHRKTHCVGTTTSKCDYDDCRYRKDSQYLTSVNLVAGDSHITEPEPGAFDQKLGSGDPLDNFKIWDTRG